MANGSDAPRAESKPQEKKKTIEVTLRVAVPEGADVVFSKGASNHYSHSSTEDTCCNCDT
jgi:hypothetical protein